MARKDFTFCCNCEDGEVFGGHVQTSPYGIDEIWKPCPVCNGTGETWKHIHRNVWYLLKEQKRRIVNRLDLFFLGYVEEDDIPF